MRAFLCLSLEVFLCVGNFAGWKLILRNGGEGMVGKLLSGGRDGMFAFDVEVLEDLY